MTETTPTTGSNSIWLVAKREFTTRATTRSFLITIGLLMVIIVVGAIVASALTGGDHAKKIGVVGTDSGLAKTIEAVGSASGTTVHVVTIRSAADARTRIAGGDLDGALVPGGRTDAYIAISKSGMDSGVDGVLRAAANQVVVGRALAARGVATASLPHATVTPEQTTATKPDQGQRIAIATIGTVLLIMAIMMGGSMVAVGVVEEKTSRVVELLLATIRPLHLLAGKILGIGAIGLAQVSLLGATALIAGLATGLLTLPAAAIGMFAAVIAWFLLGYLFFATLYAATGALVSRQEELGSTMAPLTFLAMAVMYSGIFGIRALDSTFIQILTWIPPFGAALMPIRIATGDTSVVQIVVTFVTMILACAAATWVAARIYQRSILRTGTRTTWSEALKLLR